VKKSTKKSLKVFLCHAKPDKARVRDSYKKLVTVGVDAWLDDENLLPGQDWKKEIPNAIRNSDVVIVFLSFESITREGYVNTEIKHALDMAAEKPEGEIFVIPARLEDCDVPDRLSDIHWVNLFEENGFRNLLKALNKRGESLGISAVDASVNIDALEVDFEKPVDDFENLARPLLRYLKGLDYLHNIESATLRSILTLVNIELIKKPNKKKVYYQDLAELMLDKNNLEYIVSAAKTLIIKPDTLSQFLSIIGYQMSEEHADNPNYVKDFMSPLDSVAIVDNNSNISEMVNLFMSASAPLRYIAIVDKSTKILQGIISINDFSRGIETIKNLPKDSRLIDLPFFNNNPKVVYDSNTMEDIRDGFTDMQKIGRKVTLWLVVNKDNVLVGQISEVDIVRWEVTHF